MLRLLNEQKLGINETASNLFACSGILSYCTGSGLKPIDISKQGKIFYDPIEALEEENNREYDREDELNDGFLSEFKTWKIKK